MTWEPGTVWDNVDAFVNAIGVADVGVIWGLANVDWRDTTERDTFIETVLKAGARAAGAVTEAFGQNIRAGIDAVPGLPDFPTRIQPAKKYEEWEPNPRGGFGGVEGWPLHNPRNTAVA